MWNSAALTQIDRKPDVVTLTVTFSRDDGQDQYKQVYDASFANPTAAWLARQVATTLDRLNGVDTFQRDLQLGPIAIAGPLSQAKDVFFINYGVQKILQDLIDRGFVDAGADEVKALHDAVTLGYKASYFPVLT
jgi:hypothetical protein